mmetsp:Transcript_18685/g.35780  ORF Transcript_18685/g.35780 Transcript_18685/m.35780 type:complete len:443 (-) Transcript_18685:594-1922(-)
MSLDWMCGVCGRRRTHTTAKSLKGNKKTRLQACSRSLRHICLSLRHPRDVAKSSLMNHLHYERMNAVRSQRMSNNPKVRTTPKWEALIQALILITGSKNGDPHAASEYNNWKKSLHKLLYEFEYRESNTRSKTINDYLIEVKSLLYDIQLNVSKMNSLIAPPNPEDDPRRGVQQMPQYRAPVRTSSYEGSFHNTGYSSLSNRSPPPPLSLPPSYERNNPRHPMPHHSIPPRPMGNPVPSSLQKPPYPVASRPPRIPLPPRNPSPSAPGLYDAMKPSYRVTSDRGDKMSKAERKMKTLGSPITPPPPPPLGLAPKCPMDSRFEEGERFSREYAQSQGSYTNFTHQGYSNLLTDPTRDSSYDGRNISPQFARGLDSEHILDRAAVTSKASRERPERKSYEKPERVRKHQSSTQQSGDESAKRQRTHYNIPQKDATPYNPGKWKF